MKKVILKVLNPATDQKLDYKEILSGLILRPQNQQGATAEEMIPLININKKLKKAGTPTATNDSYILLEDAEYEILNDRVKNARWPIASEEIVQLMEDVRDSEDYEIEPEKQEESGES